MAGPGRIYDLEHKLSVPLGEVDGLTEAFIRRTDGNPARWGLHQTADRLWIQPIPLVDALTREGFGILDAIFESTPLEALKGLTDGLDTQADEIEEGTGEPLVLLHGGLCTNETWAAQMPAFAERFHVVAPERRGHGHTADVPGPLTFADMATDTIGFLDRIVGGPAHLVGLE